MGLWLQIPRVLGLGPWVAWLAYEELWAHASYMGGPLGPVYERHLIPIIASVAALGL